MILFPPDKIQMNLNKIREVKSIMESTLRLITFSREHTADDLLNAYIEQTTNFRELLSIKNAQMEAQTEEEVESYSRLLNESVDFITGEVKHNIDFTTEVQLFQLFRIISPDAHAFHPNRYRDKLVRIGKYYCPEPATVPSLVSQVFENIREIDNPIIRAIYFHHEMIRIHPFSDGNGRTIRMAKNWMLTFQLYPPIFISDAEEKVEYISALEHSFEWLENNGCHWNLYLERFFNQEIDRLLRNSKLIYDRVMEAGHLRDNE